MPQSVARRMGLSVALSIGVLSLTAWRCQAASDAGADSASVREGPTLLGPAALGVGELIQDVSFTDLNGQPGTLSESRGSRATVVCMTGVGCPVAKKYAPTLAELEKTYRERGVTFLMVNA